MQSRRPTFSFHSIIINDFFPLACVKVRSFDCFAARQAKKYYEISSPDGFRFCTSHVILEHNEQCKVSYKYIALEYGIVPNWTELLLIDCAYEEWVLQTNLSQGHAEQCI